MQLTELYQNSKVITSISAFLESDETSAFVSGLAGSLVSVVEATLSQKFSDRNFLIVTNSKEEAYYLLNDLESLLNEGDNDNNKHVLLFPTTWRRQQQPEENDNANTLLRSEVIKQLNSGRSSIVVSYPEALQQKVISAKTLTKNTLHIAKGARLDMDFVTDVLQEYHFEHVDFVVEPGQYAVRGGIIDVFSFANERPFRIEFFDDTIDSLRSFDTVTQLSVRQFDEISIIPDISCQKSESQDSEHSAQDTHEEVFLTQYLAENDVVWLANNMTDCDCLDPELIDSFYHHSLITSNSSNKSSIKGNSSQITTNASPQPSFNKQFDILISTLNDYCDHGYTLMLSVGTEQQRKRLEKILNDNPDSNLNIEYCSANIHNGFVDHDEHILCFTDHEIFERYHKYKVHDLSQNREALTLKELFELKPGDYVTHIDYGVGRFSGLEKIETAGKQQEVIRLVYKGGDTLYISIHGLHKISRYVGKEGTEPPLNRLGSNTWQVLKQRTKKQVKDIARDLIALYAKRKAATGFAFSPDCYLQNELEASFLYEDTPDQHKATQDVKADMESSAPMDRLICGDVGFGKTEVAIRAAFKAVCDSKQVALLVPSTILALQHYNTFSERLKGMPVNIDYLNRFRSTKDKNRIIKDVENGKIDILIGTHAITNSKIKFKDLGLLIIDEEQKFGVSVKEKLKQMRANVDVLTLTATPIPRTLQFSLMGARDLSIIQTPPPNRQPIQTELSPFNEDIIRDAINFELSRNGQVFFINNRVENLQEMAALVNRLVPEASTAIAHGQMEGKSVEETMMRFIEGDIDVLIATAIIENGLDIPNANTMIINNAQQFGLSDLHQLRGRVGRSNRKAFCYMFVPSYNILTDEAQKRLRAIEEFANVGSGFNIAMRDLDIRGAGNILGAEQSGFISEIGYDMYHKILNEALDELKESEFQDLFRDKPENTDIQKSENTIIYKFVKECLIETDLEVLIPDDYVSNIGERLQLYKELNDLSTENELDGFRNRLIDRFGQIPKATQELIKTITLRYMAKDFGVEKIVLKQNKMVLFFPQNQDNPFYQSPNFSLLINYAQTHQRNSHLRESSARLSLVCDNVDSIHSAIEKLQALTTQQ